MSQHHQTNLGDLLLALQELIQLGRTLLFLRVTHKTHPDKNRLLTHDINLLRLPLLPLISPDNSYLEVDVRDATVEGSLVFRLLLVNSRIHGPNAEPTSFA